MKKPDLAALAAFAEVAAQGSFARAALQLGLSRSALSESIRALEERLGVRLLNRTTRSVAASEAGERLLQRLRPLLADFAVTLDSVNEFRDTPAGLLRLTVPPPAVKLLLEPLIARFLAEYPAIRLEVSVDSALVDVVRQRFDAGIRAGEQVDRDMVALRLRQRPRVVLAAAPSYLERHGRPATPHDLRAHNCIRVRFGGGPLQRWLFERGGKTLEVAVEGRLILNDLELLLAAVRDGVGIAYMLGEQVQGDLENGRLVALLEDWIPQAPDLYLYYPTRRQLPAPLQAFVAFLRRERWLTGGRPLAPPPPGP